MNVFKIAFRSVQYRGLGSFLTILSMALGVMMVVAVLSIHGVVSSSFKSNSSFGYSILVGPQGGSLQLTMNSVFYLSQPIDTIPYEYYLAFRDREQRSREMRNSIAYMSLEEYHAIASTSESGFQVPGIGLFDSWLAELTRQSLREQREAFMELNEDGVFELYTETAIPILLGDYYQKGEQNWRVCATNKDFFEKLLLDIETEKHFEFAQGRCFENFDTEAGYFGCVVGSQTAKNADLKIGDRILVTHGDPNADGSHLHDQEFTVLGILKSTGTPHDRVLFVNMEGFYLINDHIKPVQDDSVLAGQPVVEVDPFAQEEAAGKELINAEVSEVTPKLTENAETLRAQDLLLNRTPLPIEHREITSILVRTSLKDEYNILPVFLPPRIKEGILADTLAWSPFRPARAQTAVQAVSPVMEVASLFKNFVDPGRWLLLGLTILICVVSGLSILVGIYNSMSQRHHEIAVMRALGANRSKVMLIMLLESILLALSGGLLGWLGGHTLNAVLGPWVESQTGVELGFWQFAPRVPVFAEFFGNSQLPEAILQFSVSPELLLIPGLILLAVLVGIYPAIAAYRADIAKSLGK